MTGAILILAGLTLAVFTRPISRGAAVAALVIAAGFGVLAATSTSPCETDTTYHCASIEVDPARASGRELVLDNAHHSYVDLADPKHLEFAYTQWMADAILGMRSNGPLNVVFVGGGGFTLPRWLLAERPGSTAHVLEVDRELVSFDRKRLGLRTSPALRVTVGDARMSLRDVPSASADAVVGDAFGTYVIPWHLATAEWAEEVQRVLKPSGIYALNVIDNPPLDLLKAEIATLRSVFADVRMVAYSDYQGAPLGGNAVLLASDRPLPSTVASDAADGTTFEEGEVASLSTGAKVLTDDDAPVDQLLTVHAP